MNFNIFSIGNAILNYHKICPDKDFSKPMDELAVSVSKFREQLIFLKKNYNLVSLDSFLDFNKDNKPNICITFDDGYKDNLTYALPILKEFNVPATIYIITKFFKQGFNIWWFELEDYIWQNSKNIEFTYNGKNYEFTVKSTSEKLKCFSELKQIIRILDKNEQNKFLSAVTKTEVRKQYQSQFLTREDLKLLSSNPLITIGAHSHSHLSLKNLKKDDCIEEIKTSKQILEDLVNHKINHFSYPYGTVNDAGEREFL